MQLLAHGALLLALWLASAAGAVVRHEGAGTVTSALQRTGAASVQAARAAIPWSSFFITGYDDVGTTYTGTAARSGVVAVDPTVIPLGAYVQIQGLGVFRAEDTGGLIVGNRVDVWFPTAAQCYSVTGWWHVRWARERALLGAG